MRGEGEFLVIPAIDIRAGRCVRLVQGDFARETVYAADPVQVARRWVEQGARRLHLVDLDGARCGTPVNGEAIGRIVRSVDVPCQLGGGLRSTEAIAAVLEQGIEFVIVGSRAVTEPAWLGEIAERWPHRILLGLDVRDGRVAIRGWESEAGIEVGDLLDAAGRLPLAGVIYTAINRDGTLQGPDFGQLEWASHRYVGRLYASGGVASVADIAKLAAMDLAGCIVGKGLYEGTVSLAEAIAVATQVQKG